VLAAALENLWVRGKSGSKEKTLQLRPGAPKPVDRPKVVSVFPADGATDVDPVTEIRIRFDQPMDPAGAGLYWVRPLDRSSEAEAGGFRLRGTLRYVAENREFVFPVVLKPGVRHRVEICQPSFDFPGTTARDFNTPEGVGSAQHVWQFTTRPPAANPQAPRPRVVSIDPPPGSETGVFTPVRVGFDRPMDPNCFGLVDATSKNQAFKRTAVPFPVEYDPRSNVFTFGMYLPASTKTRLELRGFRGADGAEAEPMSIEYRAGGTLYTAREEARIAAAGRSAKLRELVEAVRRKRLTVTSVDERVRSLSLWAERPGWSFRLNSNGGRFAFQGQRQFYADVSGIMKSPFLVGSDGQQCWRVFRHKMVTDTLGVCPYEAVQEKYTGFCDAFGAGGSTNAAEVIRKLQLEDLGVVEYDGKPCCRIRSWKGLPVSEYARGGIQDWLIDAKTLLPALHEMYFEEFCLRTEFAYDRVNEPLPAELFQPPKRPGLKPQPLEPLEEGCDRYFLNARDGSDGRMTVRWGQFGPKRRSSSGLN
jgi:hypothetical protein